MSGNSEFDVRSTDAAKSDGPNQDPRTLARLQDDARVDDASQLLSWGKHNLGRYDVSGDNRLSLGELDLGLRTTGNADDIEMLSKMEEQFGSLKGRRDAISVGDLQKNLENQQKLAEQNELARQQQARMEQLQAGSRDLMKPLLQTNDGNPDGSLFRVLDTMRDRKPDNEISKRDLQKFMDEYSRRSRTGDTGTGQFTPQSRDYVENLLNNWDSPEVKRLRGTWRDSQNYERTNSSITAESLAEAGALSTRQTVFTPFVNAELAPRKEAPTVRAEMAREITPPTNMRKFERDPRIDDQLARDAEAERIQDAKGLQSWGKNNLGRYDITGDKALNYGEVDHGIRTTQNFDSYSRLNQIQEEFPTLQSGNKVRQRDLDRHVTRAQQTFESNEVVRQTRFVSDRNIAGSRDLMAPMMETPTGHPNDSLFKVLDGIRGDVDDKIGKKDLKRFTEEYDWRSRNGDVGSGHYTPQNRAYVQQILDNWDSTEVRRLRGTYTVQDNFGRSGGNRTREVANGSISAKSLNAAVGTGHLNDAYALYVKPEGK